MAGDATRELTRLLRRWRGVKRAGTSRLIHCIGAAVEFAPPPLPAKEPFFAWLDVVEKEGPAALTARLAQLEPLARAAIDVSFRDQRAGNDPLASPDTRMFRRQRVEVWRFFEALSRWPEDPRIATFAMRVLLHADALALWDFRLGNDTLVVPLIACFERHADARHWRALKVTLQNYQRDVRYSALNAALRAWVPPGFDGEREARAEFDALRRLDWSFGTFDPQPGLEAVHANPFDLTLRQVVADALMEAGDPRGEFIALQLAKRDDARQAALLKEHRRVWCGPLETFGRCEFEDGFITSVRFEQRAPYFVREFSGLAQWATVKRVWPMLPGDIPGLRALEDAGFVDPPLLPSLVSRGLPLRALRTQLNTDDTLATLRGVSTLEALAVGVPGTAMAARVMSAQWPALKRLDVLLGSIDDGVTAWLETRERQHVRTIRLCSPRYRVEEGSMTAPFVLTRELDGVTLELPDAWYFMMLSSSDPPLVRLLDAGPLRMVAYLERPNDAGEAHLRSECAKRNVPLKVVRGKPT